jgi:hypothetical protein
VVPIASQAAPDADFRTAGNVRVRDAERTGGWRITVPDVDGGKTTLQSRSTTWRGGGRTPRSRPAIAAGTGTVSAVPRTTCGAPTSPNDGGSNWTNVETIADGHGGWDLVNVNQMALFGNPAQVKFRFIAEDALGGSVVEGGIDDFEIVAITVPAVSVSPMAGVAAVQLGPAMPNPANASVSMSLTLPRRRRFMPRSATYGSARSRTLINGTLPARFDDAPVERRASEQGNRAPVGVYFLRIATGETTLERKVVLGSLAEPA